MATRAEREQEEAEAKQQQERQRQQQQRDQAGQGVQQNPNNQVNEERRRQNEEQAKKQGAYLDEMNKKLGDVVNTAAGMKDQDPQLLNYTVEALKRAAAQLEGGTPPNVSTSGQPMNRAL